MNFATQHIQKLDILGLQTPRLQMYHAGGDNYGINFVWISWCIQQIRGLLDKLF